MPARQSPTLLMSGEGKRDAHQRGHRALPRLYRWHGDDEAREAVYGNRNRLKSGVGKEAIRKRGEIVERSFAHVLKRGGMRRT